MFETENYRQRSWISASQGEKIIQLQNLFKAYSGLSFASLSDHLLATDGI